MNKHKARGFTLMELMIVVAVIGILAAIAYPSYLSSIRKGKRAQARTALADLMQQQERYMTQRNCYLAFSNTAANAVTITALASGECGGVVATAVPFKTYSGDSLAAAAYTLSADRCPASGGGTLAMSECIRLNAAPITPDPEAGNLTMTSTGVKDCDGTKKTVAGFCWP